MQCTSGEVHAALLPSWSGVHGPPAQVPHLLLLVAPFGPGQWT
jgi:hypothetical protein